jgi:uncharacterized membrane protein
MSELAVNRSRIQSLDILRGVVMVIMALDHVRDFFHGSAFLDSPTNLETTSPALFFTRWITHYCAPVFVFLAGTSGFLSGQRRTKKQLSFFLLTRGLWLVIAEILLVTLALTFNPEYNALILQVIWAIGMSMIILGLLVWLPFYVIMAYGLIVVFGHNLLDYPEAARGGEVPIFWNILHRAHFFFVPISDERGFLFVYAFFPWSGVMALGYCFGKLFARDFDPARRRKLLFFIGFGLILLFIILRFINGYGNPTGWSSQPRGTVYTILSFLDVNKYPPSLMFICMTIGPAIVALALLENVKVTGVGAFFRTFGRVPFFYYIIHFYFIHLICVVAFYATGNGNAQIVDPNSPFFFRPAAWGFNLWIVYAIWTTLILALYPLCRWYEKYKARKNYWWLSYI